MTVTDETGAAGPGADLVRDETGRARLRFGDSFFETVLQPSFRFDGAKLRPDFATARIRPGEKGTVPAMLARLQDGPGHADAAALARCNLPFLDPETLCFCEDFHASGAMAAATLDLLLAAAHDAYMMPDQFVWRLPASVADAAQGAIDRARDAGMRIALRMDGSDPGLFAAKAAGCGAEIAHLGVEWSGAWLENVPEARKLLRHVVERLWQAGCGVSMTGISSAGQLDAALAAGVRWVQGGYLAPGVVAGRATGWQDLSASALRQPGANVTVLKHGPKPRHQQT